MTRIRAVAMLLATVSTLRAVPAIAQSGPSRSRVEIGAGLLWAGSIPLGVRAATETTASGGTSALFSTTSELAGVAGLEGRIGVRVTESIGLEGQVSYVKPEQRIAVRLLVDGKDKNIFLAAGARGHGAIYTEHGKLLHIIRKVFVRVSTKFDWFVAKLH